MTLISSKYTGAGKYLREFRVGNESEKDAIDTSELATGSNVIVCDSTSAFYWWNEDVNDWVKHEG